MTLSPASGAPSGDRFQVGRRVARVIEHLGLDQVHVAGRLETDWTDLLAEHGEVVRSLSLVFPTSLSAAAVSAIASRLLVITDDQPARQEVRRAVASLPGAEGIVLRDYSGVPWADVAAERRDEVAAAMLGFLGRVDGDRPAARRAALTEGEGEIDGVTYRIQGSGPPLVLLPLWLAPSQWSPLLPALSERYCTITLGGPEVGFVPLLEARGRSGYLRVVRSVVDEAPLGPGHSILEVGCGSGVLCRWLARRTGRANPITGVDMNRYLLHEAAALAAREGLEDTITFREGDALALPFEAGRFDFTIACTVLEEGDADRMLAEMVRVTKPGGTVAAIVRAVDLPSVVNLGLGSGLKAKVESPGLMQSLSKGGCADASLYPRMRDAGLVDLKYFPQLGALTGPMGYFYIDRLRTVLDAGEAAEWDAAVAAAETVGTLFVATPFHCGVGRKPA